MVVDEVLHVPPLLLAEVTNRLTSPVVSLVPSGLLVLLPIALSYLLYIPSRRILVGRATRSRPFDTKVIVFCLDPASYTSRVFILPSPPHLPASHGQFPSTCTSTRSSWRTVSSGETPFPSLRSIRATLLRPRPLSPTIFHLRLIGALSTLSRFTSLSRVPPPAYVSSRMFQPVSLFRTFRESSRLSLTDTSLSRLRLYTSSLSSSSSLSSLFHQYSSRPSSSSSSRSRTHFFNLPAPSDSPPSHLLSRPLAVSLRPSRIFVPPFPLHDPPSTAIVLLSARVVRFDTRDRLSSTSPFVGVSLLPSIPVFPPYSSSPSSHPLPSQLSCSLSLSPTVSLYLPPTHTHPPPSSSAGTVRIGPARWGCCEIIASPRPSRNQAPRVTSQSRQAAVRARPPP